MIGGAQHPADIMAERIARIICCPLARTCTRQAYPELCVWREFLPAAHRLIEELPELRPVQYANDPAQGDRLVPVHEPLPWLAKGGGR